MNGVISPTYLYKDEAITITCTATEYTDIVRLILINGDLSATVPQTGCVRNIIGAWGAANNELTAAIGLSTNATSTHCRTAAQPAPFSITVQGTVTSAIVGARLACVATVSATEQDQTDPPFEVPSIRGRYVIDARSKFVINLIFNIEHQRTTFFF